MRITKQYGCGLVAGYLLILFGTIIAWGTIIYVAVRIAKWAWGS